MRFAFTVSFIGKNYYGFQIQPNEVTIQEELEKAFRTILREKIKVITSGRTDTQVSGVGLVIHVEIHNLTAQEKTKNLSVLIYSLNSVLPRDISIIYGRQVSDNFHARFSALSREYVYFIYNAPYVNASFLPFSLWIRKELDQKAMLGAVNYLIGEKDFAAFTRGIYQKNKEPTVRRIDRIDIIQKDPFIIFYYKGSGFLHNMIRIITGTLLMVGKKNLKPSALNEILENKKREYAGVTLPPHPLFFLNAEYDEYNTPKKYIPFYSLFLDIKE